MQALLRYPKHLRKRIASEWGKRSKAVQQQKRMARGIDAETAYRHSLDALRGKLIDSGTDYRSGKERHWQIRHSLAGRINQVDLLINGSVWKTGSLNTARSAIHSGVWTPRRATRFCRA